jgi:F-type H+-transporting ATPase subunit delta
MTNRVAYRYALAILGEAEEKKMTARVASDMHIIEESLVENTLLRAVIATPVIRPQVLLNALNEIYGKHLSKEVMDLISLLVHKGRGDLLGSVAENFLLILDEKQNIATAHITSARELDNDSKEQILSKLKKVVKMDIRPFYKVDPSLRGGFIAKVGDTLIDASLRNQLELLRERLKHQGMANVN